MAVRVIKHRGHTEPYDGHKLYASMYAAALAVREPAEAAELVARDVLEAVENWLGDKQEVTSLDIRTHAASVLERLNKYAAYQYRHHRHSLEGGALQHKRPRKFDYDLIVIGTGAGGGVAAELSAKAGRHVAVVEMEVLGGECPNFGCVPTKALLQAAEIYETTKRGPQFGVKATSVSVNYQTIKRWKDQAVANTGTTEGEAMYRRHGITVIKGRAYFVTPWVISVNGRRYSARKFLIATGTLPSVAPIPGLRESGYITYRDAIDFTKPPKSVFIIGGGAIGCEFAQLLSAFDVKIHIAEMAPRLVALEDPEVGELLGAVFESRGISVHIGVTVTRVSKRGTHKVVRFEKDGQAHEVTVEEVLLATGKAPNTDLGLVNAGVAYGRGGIETNSFMQTSTKHIYAAGDSVGPYRFTHTASYQSRIAAHNMFHEKNRHRAVYHAVPRCVFVDPEIACAGLTEKQLKDRGIKYQVGAAPISVIGRSNTSAQDTGFVKVLADQKGRLLGAAVVSPRAGEVIHELTLAIHAGLTARQVAETIHAFPTWSETVRLACQKVKSK